MLLVNFDQFLTSEKNTNMLVSKGYFLQSVVNCYYVSFCAAFPWMVIMMVISLCCTHEAAGLVQSCTYTVSGCYKLVNTMLEAEAKLPIGLCSIKLWCKFILVIDIFTQYEHTNYHMYCLQNRWKSIQCFDSLKHSGWWRDHVILMQSRQYLLTWSCCIIAITFVKKGVLTKI